jgi:hypothetical protein
LLVDHDGLVMEIGREGGLAAYHRRHSEAIAGACIAPKTCVTAGIVFIAICDTWLPIASHCAKVMR